MCLRKTPQIIQGKEKKMLQIPQSLCTELTDEQASTVQGGKKLRIKSITALKANADWGWWWKDDDLYAVVDGERFDVGGFKTGDSKQVNIVKEVGSEGIVRFFDDDRFTSDDPVGSMRITKNVKDGNLVVFGSGSKYEIRYSFGFG